MTSSKSGSTSSTRTQILPSTEEQHEFPSLQVCGWLRRVVFQPLFGQMLFNEDMSRAMEVLLAEKDCLNELVSLLGCDSEI